MLLKVPYSKDKINLFTPHVALVLYAGYNRRKKFIIVTYSNAPPNVDIFILGKVYSYHCTLFITVFDRGVIMFFFKAKRPDTCF